MFRLPGLIFVYSAKRRELCLGKGQSSYPTGLSPGFCTKGEFFIGRAEKEARGRGWKEKTEGSLRELSQQTIKLFNLTMLVNYRQ